MKKTIKGISKGITLLLILSTFSVNANAFSISTWLSLGKNSGYKASQSLFVSKSKLRSIHSKRKAEFYAIRENKGKKFPKLKVWTKSIAKSAKSFTNKPSIAVWYTSFQNNKKRYVARNPKTGLTIVFSLDFRIVTTYFSTSKKIKSRVKKGSLTFKKRGEIKEIIADSKYWEKVLKDSALIVNTGLWW
ncbi:MAG TPA: hypothetical protein EYG89_02340 [Bacteroidia bacterium]|nr:hypothetical protein [Bacteroidia bacterium]